MKNIYNISLLHASARWVLRIDDTLRLEKRQRAVIMHYFIPDRVSIVELYIKLEISSLVSSLRKVWLSRFGHTQCTDQWFNKIKTFQVTGNAGRRRQSGDVKNRMISRKMYLGLGFNDSQANNRSPYDWSS